MATEHKDVELRVRARDYSQKTLDAVTSSLEDMTKAQDAQVAAAKKGEVSAKSLADSYDKIENAVKALIGQHALTKVFDTQAAALEKAKQKADDARTAYTAYADSMAGVENKTKKQVAEQNRLAAAIEGADKKVLTAQSRLDRTSAKLGEFGIATGNIAAAQKRMADGVVVGNLALEKQALALDGVADDIARKVAADQAAADAAKKNADDQVAAQRKITEATAAAAAQQAKNASIAQAAHQKQAEKLKAEREIAAAMRQSAQQAEAAAKGYATLARSVNSVRGNELSDHLKAINDPAKAAISTMEGLEASVGKLGAKVAAIKGPVKDFRTTMEGLEAAQKGVEGIGRQIDAYRRQIDVLRAARTEYAAARAAVTSLTQQMKAGGGDAAELGRQLSAAESRLKSAAGVMATQTGRTRELRDALRATGVDTRNLADAETRLISQARLATGSVDALSAAYRKNGAAAEGASKGQFKFFESTRTTLSYTQRLRGELLALATGYIGVQAAIGVATGAISSFKTAQKIEGQIGAAFGNDAATIRKEWDYLMATADRIGISFQEAAPAYAKFAIAAKAFGLSGDEIRFTFENVAKAARVAGLSADEFQGVLKAMEQGLSKGSLQAEEIRGQLGDRLPGAFTLLAASMKISTAELGKMMEAGAVTAAELITFARDLPNTFKPTESTYSGLIAAQERYNNAIFKFQLAIANSGFADAFTKLLVDLTNLMNSADGQQFAQNLSSAFTMVVDVMRFLIAHTDELKIAFSALVGLTVFKWAMAGVKGITALFTIIRSLWTTVAGVTTALRTVGTTMGTMGTAAGGAAVGLRIMGVAVRGLLGPLGAVLLAVEAAIWAYDKLAKKQKTIKTDTKLTGNGAEGSWDAPEVAGPPQPKPGQVDTPDPETGPDAGKRAATAFDKDAEARQKKLDKDRKSARKKSAKDELDERADLIREEYKMIRDNAERTITDKDALSARLLTLDKQMNQAIETDRIRFNAEHAKSNAAAANKEVSLKEQVKNELLRIQDEIARDEAKLDANASFEDRKKTRLDAIAHSYDKLKKTITQLAAVDKAAAAEASKKLDEYIAARQEVEATKVTLEEVRKLEKELSDQQALRTSKIEEQTALYESGALAQQDFLTAVANINKDADVATANAARNLQAFVDAQSKLNPGLLTPVEQADIKTRTTRGQVSNSGNENNDKANAAQIAAIDTLIAKREAADAIYKAQFDLKMISEDEYAAKVNANAEAYKTKILELNAVLLANLEAQKAQGLLDGTLTSERLAALDAEIAKRQLLATTVGNTLPQLDQFNNIAKQALGQGLDTALNGLVSSLTALAQGTQTAGEAFKSMAQTAMGALAQLLQQIALAIMKQLILNSLAGMGGGIGGIAMQLGGVAVKHRGGVIGAPNGTVRRNADPSWFAGAPRYHDGGVPGLKSDEVPAILQTNEEVLSRDDPRNVLNGGAGGGNSAGTRFVLVDDRSKIPEAMSGAEGQEVIVQTIRRNVPAIKQLLR